MKKLFFEKYFYIFAKNINIMNEKVKEIVKQYVIEHIDKSDNIPTFDVCIDWQGYIIGNVWLLSTTLCDEMFYEVTYNKAKDEFYLNVYKKIENRCIKNT